MNKSLIIARKEFTDAITSKRFWAVMGLFFLLYVAGGYVTSFAFRIGGFTESRGLLRTTSSVVSTMSLIAPILGIALAFDAISGERERGTLKVLLSRPLYREHVINGKIVSALALIGLTITVSSVLSISASVLLQGTSVTFDDVVRICLFIALSILFSFAYYSISLFISTFSSRSSHSLTISLGVWIFFAFVLSLLGSLIALAVLGSGPAMSFSREFNQTGGGRQVVISEAFLNYSRRVSEITNTVQAASINHHYSLIADSLFVTSVGPFGQQAQQIDLMSLLASRWVDILVVTVFPVIFLVASYMAFTRRQER
jgi:ABC-2 type transport system permease protein